MPGVPTKSRLLTMPLAHEAGGTEFHPGGKHWATQNDPQWKTMADWVKNAAHRRRILTPSMTAFRYYLRVRYIECDAQKVVFNSRYSEYVDAVDRTSFCARRVCTGEFTDRRASIFSW